MRAPPGDDVRLSRADFLRLATSAWAAWLVSTAVPSAGRGAQSVDDRQARIARVIEEYDRQGLHRTGTETDNRSAAWLAAEARRSGADVSLETFRLARVDIHRSFVDASDRRIEGLPLFDGTFTNEGGVTGRVGPPGSDADIALVRLDSTGISAEGRSLAELRKSSRYKGVLVVTEGAHPGLSPVNAPAFTAPFGPPALQVSSEERIWLERLAANQTEIRLVVHADRTPSDAINVIAQIVGTDAGLSPLAVMTPRSGWWQCTAERGGGLACWLEVIRMVSSAKAPRTVLFVASSGHELGHLGLESFLVRRSDLIKRATAWIHLGANLGAAGGRMRVQASDDGIEQMAVGALTRAGAGVPDRVTRGTVPAGEARNIHIGGGRYLSLLGSSPFFHNAADRWPTAVDPPAVAQYATATADLAVSLALSTG